MLSWHMQASVNHHLLNVLQKSTETFFSILPFQKPSSNAFYSYLHVLASQAMNSYKSQDQLYFQQEPILSLSHYGISLLRTEERDQFLCGVFLLWVCFVFFYLTKIIRIFSSLTLFVKTSLNCLDLENKGRFMMPFLTVPYRKVHSQTCCSCHLFQENLKVELFIWSDT